MMVVTINGEPVLLAKVGGCVRAYSNRCPHQLSPLDEGQLEGGRLTCARHHWEFDASNGRGINPAGAELTCFGCEIRGDGSVYVDLHHE